MLGFFTSMCLTVTVLFGWYFILFKGHANKITKNIIRFHINAGLYHRSLRRIYHPLILKIFATLLLFTEIFTVYLSIYSVRY